MISMGEEAGKNTEEGTKKLRPWFGALVVALAASLLFYLSHHSESAPGFFLEQIHEGPIDEADMAGGTKFILDLGIAGQEEEQSLEIIDTLLQREVHILDSAKGRITIATSHSGEEAQAWAQRVLSSGHLSMHEVLEDSEFMRQAYALLEKETDIDRGIDQWIFDETGKNYTDYYLKSSDPNLIDNWFQKRLQSGTLALPDNATLLYEQVIPYDDTIAPYWRSYLASAISEISEENIADASVYWDPTSNKPEVLIEFDEDGGRAFATLTGRIVGRKLIIAIDGQVNSAPTVQAKIAGGSTTISMGGNSAKKMQDEAQDLARALRSRPLPATVYVESFEPITEIEPISDNERLLARLMSAFTLFILLFLVCWALLWRFPKASRAIVRDSGDHPSLFRKAIPLLVSIGGVLITYRLSLLLLPGVDEFIMTGIGTGAIQPSLSVSALGIMPFITGIVIVEMVVWLVPGWRKHRSQSHRSAISQAGLIVGMLILAGLAYFLATNLTSVDSYFGSSNESVQPKKVMGALILASSVLYGIAKGIDRYGVGNGFALVLSVPFLLRLPEAWEGWQLSSIYTYSHFATNFTVLILAMLGTVFLLRRSISLGNGGTVALPGAGLAPILIVEVTLAAILLVLTALSAHEKSYWIIDHLSLLLLVPTAVLSVVISLFAMRVPHASGGTRVVAGVSRTGDRSSIALAFGLSVIFPLAILYAIQSRTPEPTFSAGLILIFVLAIAMVMDIIGDIRTLWHNPNLVTAWKLHRPRYLQPIVDSLDHADIEVVVRGQHFRTLLSVFGAFAPMTIRVPKERAEDAKTLIREAL